MSVRACVSAVSDECERVVCVRVRASTAVKSLNRCGQGERERRGVRVVCVCVCVFAFTTWLFDITIFRERGGAQV